MTAKIVVECLACRQQNRTPVNAVARCGRCGALLDTSGEPREKGTWPNGIDLDAFGARLAAADKAQAFGRMHFPQDYRACGCHVHDTCRHGNQM